MKTICWLVLLLGLLVSSLVGATSLDKPWITDTFFYWYGWDYEAQKGGWIGGVYWTPLNGYYDSSTYQDNYDRLKLAADWGVTGHFMDYWAPNWLDREGKPRESLLMRASEQLSSEGYDVFMSYYQDGEDFDQKDFARNMDPGRDVFLMLERSASSPAYPKLEGKPFHVVYARNGVPALTTDNEGFRSWALARYGDLRGINEAWGASFSEPNEVKLDFGSGPWRADSIRFQIAEWKRQWAELDDRIKQQFGFEGLYSAQDVGYAPFRGFGYTPLFEALAGPQSYGGIFGQPHDQDEDRLIQSLVSKYYPTPFFDCWKNNYCDWEIRLQGVNYRPDPFIFDRFFVGDLLRYNEAMLHMSFNEWWEGSPLEPTQENGKKFLEKTLQYSTLMQLWFPALKHPMQEAEVAVILSDWSYMTGAIGQAEQKALLQELRRLNVPFRLIPDTLFKPELLEGCKVVIAPTCGADLGQNFEGKAIGPELIAWVKAAPDRRLVASRSAFLTEQLGARLLGGATVAAGPDQHFVLDVGAAGDERYLLSGYSGPETWGWIEEDPSARWTPAVSPSTKVLIAVSPGRDQEVRILGSATWANTLYLTFEGQSLGSFAIQTGLVDVRADLPANRVGGRTAGALEISWAKSNVPGELAPAQYPNEQRICNLGLSRVEVVTSGTGFDSPVQYEAPQTRLTGQPAGASFGFKPGKTLQLEGYEAHDYITLGEVLATYAQDGLPYAMELALGQGKALYTNGSLSALLAAGSLAPILENWASVEAPREITGQDVIGTVLPGEGSDLVLAYNYNVFTQPKVEFAIQAKAHLPLAEVMAVSVDGERYEEAPAKVSEGRARFSDQFGYFGIYSLSYCRVKPQTPALSLCPGERTTWRVKLTNLTDSPVEGTVQLVSVIPTLGGEALRFSLSARESRNVEAPVAARADCDWGYKTAVLRLTIEGAQTDFLRRIIIEQAPELKLSTPVLDAANPALTLENAASRFSPRSSAGAVVVQAPGGKASLGEVKPGEQATGLLSGLALGQTDVHKLTRVPLTAQYSTRGEATKTELAAWAASLPEEYKAPEGVLYPLAVANASEKPLDNWLCEWKLTASVPRQLYVVAESGAPVPSQVCATKEGRSLYFIAQAPARGVAYYFVCEGAGPAVSTDLVAEEQNEARTINLATGELALTLDGLCGGTLTKLKSRATGLDYASRTSGTFGAGYGVFGQYQPDRPLERTETYVQDKLTWQRDKPAEVRLVESGPARAVVEVTWEDAGLAVKQRYEVFAYQPWFTVETELVPKQLPEGAELVAQDARFELNNLTKTFPNFVGEVKKDTIEAQFGWREANWVPPFVSFMTPPDYLESLSVIKLEASGLNFIRQGFWTAKRPERGRARWAEAEFVARDYLGSGLPKRIHLKTACLLHQGHQPVAAEWLQQVQENVILLLPGNWRATGERLALPEVAPALAKPAWWSPEWPLRAEIRQVGEAGPFLAIKAAVDELATQLGSSGLEAKVVWLDDAGHLLGATTAFPLDYGAHGHYLASMRPDEPASAAWLYLRPSSRPLASPRARGITDGSFALGQWTYGAGTGPSEEGRTDSASARLDTRGATPAQLSYPGFDPLPNSEYEVRFWARSTEGTGTLWLNFYGGAHTDFGQLGVSIEAGQPWKQYTVTLPVGDFLPAGWLGASGERPGLRFFAREAGLQLLMDDVEVVPLREADPWAKVPLAELGGLERVY